MKPYALVVLFVLVLAAQGNARHLKHRQKSTEDPVVVTNAPAATPAAKDAVVPVQSTEVAAPQTTEVAAPQANQVAAPLPTELVASLSKDATSNKESASESQESFASSVTGADPSLDISNSLPPTASALDAIESVDLSAIKEQLNQMDQEHERLTEEFSKVAASAGIAVPLNQDLNARTIDPQLPLSSDANNIINDANEAKDSSPMSTAQAVDTVTADTDADAAQTASAPASL
eukprot:GILK01000480.1.p1 GENE.GILK01000480.1~~GILK01000480.1.p1  ORF type:complete len:246 (+),score=60.99 GILK01000480.1:41-739(+)